MTGHVSDMCS